VLYPRVGPCFSLLLAACNAIYWLCGNVLSADDAAAKRWRCKGLFIIEVEQQDVWIGSKHVELCQLRQLHLHDDHWSWIHTQVNTLSSLLWV